MTVRLSPGAETVSISYIAPSPVWRVSYRLVADEVDDLKDGKGLLQGWALFDNTLDEDLENVELTFVAGMPVSFIYDLYTPFTPERPVVQEEARQGVRPGGIRGRSRCGGASAKGGALLDGRVR